MVSALKYEFECVLTLSFVELEGQAQSEEIGEPPSETVVEPKPEDQVDSSGQVEDAQTDGTELDGSAGIQETTGSTSEDGTTPSESEQV